MWTPYISKEEPPVMLFVLNWYVHKMPRTKMNTVLYRANLKKAFFLKKLSNLVLFPLRYSKKPSYGHIIVFNALKLR